MPRAPRAIAALIFVAIAAFLVHLTRIPALEGLRKEEARVGNIAAQDGGWHDGRAAYDAIAGKQSLIDYATHQRMRMIGGALAAAMLLLAYGAWKRPNPR